MSNGYIESSLKRFLKRKVKVTLGLVVAFMITGTVGFAAAEGSIEWHKQQADEWLAGRGQKSLTFDEVTAGDTTITNTDGGITITFKDTDPVIISKDDISEKVSGNIQIALDLVSGKEDIDISTQSDEYKYGFNLKTEEEKVLVNEGVLNTSQVATNGKVVINKGKIEFTGEKGQNLIKGVGYNYGIIANNGKFGQAIDSTAEGYNYGIIANTGDFGQQIKSKGYNYGIIANKGVYGQNIYLDKAEGYNHGIIANKGTSGQSITAKEAIGYNYGIIKNTESQGQRITGTSAKGYNYGIIENETTQGQSITGDKAEGFNYGIIKNKTTEGMYVDNNTAKGYNYGIIENLKDNGIKANKGTAFNYGVVKNSTGSIFAGSVTNNGIVILTNNQTSANMGTGENNGVVLNKDYSFNTTISGVNVKDKVKDLTTDKNIAGSENESVYYTKVNENSADFVTVNAEKLSDKHLTSIITNTDGTAYKYTGENLTLEDTTVMGYFTDGGTGTLLEVSDNLTLVNSKINAVTDIGNSQNVTAVKLSGGTLTQVGESEIVGKITGEGAIDYVALHSEGNQNISLDSGDIILSNDDGTYNLAEEDNYTDVTFNTLNADSLVLKFNVPDSQNINKVTINNGELQSVNGSDSTEQIDLTINSTAKIGEITLGQNDDTLTVIGSSSSEHGNVFDYKVNNAENVVLDGQIWHIGENAQFNGSQGHDENSMDITVKNDGELHIEMFKGENGNVVSTSFDRLIEGANISITTEDDSKIKYVIGEGFVLDQKEYNLAKYYDITNANVDAAVIFDVERPNNGADVKLTVRDAEYFGLENYKGLYSAVLGGLSNNEELRNAVNYQDDSKFVDMITEAGATAEAFYTTGYAVTKDVTDTYMSVVEDFGRKAGKGEWIAYGKYVNTDSEFDGGKASRGYDGDITGTVGMLEYGVNNTTSYGAVFGMGDTEVDINGGGKLDGDNTYFGAYVKHRTQSGIDLLGNIGFTKSELDLNLATETTVGDVDYHIITDGSSDADALTFSLKGRKDYRISDSVILQPVAGLRYSLISQDAVESRNANFRIDEQDVTIFEGTVGGNIIKEFDISNGKLALMAGAEFVLTEISNSDDARYTLYEKNIELTGEEDIADNRVEAHVGAEYIHENGVGVDVKYEFIWTDKGDSDRITAGVSYKF